MRRLSTIKHLNYADLIWKKLHETGVGNLMKSNAINKMVLSAVFLSIGMVLPLLTMQAKEIGDSLLPMHFPVMLCGLLCGPYYGGFIGLVMPFLRWAVFGMPNIYPQAVWMALELFTYGLVIGLVYRGFKQKSIVGVYISLIVAMLSGRVVWGAAKAVLLGVGGKPFTFSMFVAGGFIDAALGIILQLILIPLIITVLRRIKHGKG